MCKSMGMESDTLDILATLEIARVSGNSTHTWEIKHQQF